MKYPDEAYHAGIEGVVQVGFIIKRDGSVNNIMILSPLSKECDHEVLQIIQSMDELEFGWEPAQLRENFVDYFKPSTLSSI